MSAGYHVLSADQFLKILIIVSECYNQGCSIFSLRLNLFIYIDPSNFWIGFYGES